jgi:hypothetical protein
MPYRIPRLFLHYQHTLLKSDSGLLQRLLLILLVLWAFPRIRYLTHDITGGHEKLALLYLLSVNQLATRPLGDFSSEPFTLQRLRTFSPCTPHASHCSKPEVSSRRILLVMQRMITEWEFALEMKHAEILLRRTFWRVHLRSGMHLFSFFFSAALIYFPCSTKG